MVKRTATYFGFKPRWKQSPDNQVPARRTTSHDFEPVRRRSGPPGITAGPKMQPRQTIIDLKKGVDYFEMHAPKPRQEWVRAKQLLAAMQRNKTLQRLAKFGTKAHPYLKAINYALDAYDWWNENTVWADSGLPTGIVGFQGFTKTCDMTPYAAPLGIGWDNHWFNITTPPHCGLGGQVPSHAQEAWPSETGLIDTIYRGPITLYIAPNHYRYQIREAWQRPASKWNGSAFPTPIPVYATPKAWPMPTTLAPPDPLVSEKTSPLPPPQWLTKPSTKPYEVPATSIDLGPPGYPPGRPVITHEPHKLVPPNARTRERKMLIVKRAPLVAAVGAAYGFLTEVGDIIDAVHKALPKKFQRGRNMKDKARDIIIHWKHIDPYAAAYNIAADQLQDFVIAKASKAADRINQSPYWDRPVGPDAGGFQQRNVSRLPPVKVH